MSILIYVGVHAIIGLQSIGEAIIELIAPNGNQFFLNKVGEKYSVTVQKDGYTGKSQTIENMGNQVIKVTLTEGPQS